MATRTRLSSGLRLVRSVRALLGQPGRSMSSVMVLDVGYVIDYSAAFALDVPEAAAQTEAPCDQSGLRLLGGRTSDKRTA